MKKLISLLLAFVILLSPVGCAKRSPAAMTYGSATISQAMYKYHLATYKALYVSAYDDIKDDDSFWLSFVGDTEKTGEEYVEELIYESVAQNLIAAAEFDKAGLHLTGAQTKTVDDYISDLTDEVAGGSRKNLNSYLGEFGINVNIFRDVLLMETKAEAYFEHLFGKGGSDPVDDSDREKYYRDNYVRFLQIYINDVQVYETDEDGKYIQDENFNYKTRPLTEEEKKAAADKIAAVKAGLEAGKDFAGLQKEYSDSKDYAGGYYFSPYNASNYLTPVVSAAFTLEEGEWIFVEEAKSVGAFFIMRLPLDDGAYKAEANKDFFEDLDDSVASKLFSDMLGEKMDEIVVDEAFMDSLSVRVIEGNYYLY